MTKKKPPKTVEPPFGLDMSFGEALERFIGTDLGEVEASIARSKKKKPPGNKSKKPGGNDQSGSVVDLKVRRVRKRNTGR